MNNESFVMIKNHCQNILDVICKIENANDGQTVDQPTVLQELSSCVTSFEKLGESLQLIINEQSMMESDEHQTEEQLLVTNEVDSQDVLPPDVESNSDIDANMISQLISGTFDGTMTLENLRRLSHSSSDKHPVVSDENYVNEISDNDQTVHENSLCTNNGNGTLDLQDGSLIIVQDTSGINGINSIDLPLDMIVMDSEIQIMADAFTVQTEEIVTTANDIADSEEENAAVEPKRKRKLETISDVDIQLENILPKQKRQTNENIPIAVTLHDASNAEWLTEQDQLSISSTQSDIENGEYLEVDIDLVDIRNTNTEIHCKNPSYQAMCLLCGQNDPLMPEHYLKHHPKQEVLVARPSPQMATRLRLQTEKFITSRRDGTKGLCYFCEENKTMSSSGWETHIITHTGEKLYTCEGCHLNFDQKSNHDDDKCRSELVNIFRANSTDRSLVGFMCKECNYLQIELKRIIEHLTNEHAYECPAEKYHYEKLTLVSIAKQDSVQSEAVNSLLTSTQETPTANPPNRKSIAFILPKLHRNTNADIHYKNQKACLLCNDTIQQSLIYHYTKCHPEHEVFIARPSPQAADKLRSQDEQFAVNKQGKIVGICYFCDEIKTMNRITWRQHILKHTGEKAYCCTRCAIEVNYKKQHDTTLNITKCDGKLFDICEINSFDDSYVGFMCNECNYVQVKLERMIKHLTDEHDYNTPTENRHYQKYTLLPGIRAQQNRTTLKRPMITLQ